FDAPASKLAGVGRSPIPESPAARQGMRFSANVNKRVLMRQHRNSQGLGAAQSPNPCRKASRHLEKLKLLEV
ncbi:hypothetical protein, partial [uncultured Treponema sp.]|uniref:hypothetical protein n=1 Tax=uncultured Treponema sp. TaxID=162155 RepID=UPI00280A7535